MEPVVIEKGSGYEIEWASQNVQMIVSMIKDGRFDDSVKAEVKVFHAGSGITRSSPTLTSESGKLDLTRKLNRRRKGTDYQIDWEACVEEMAGIIIDKHREGKPSVVIKDIPQEENLQWRVENIMLEDINLIYGDGGSGKSLTACLIASLIDSGHMTSEHQLVVEPGRVYFLDWETSPHEIRNRINSIHKGHGINSESNVVYRQCQRPFLEDYDIIMDEISERQIDVVIIDSMGMSVGGDLEGSTDINAFFRGLRKLGKPVLLISHKNKSGQIFGSQYTYNNSRMIWELIRSETSMDDDVDIVMFHRKGNNVPQQSEMAWRIIFDEENNSVEFQRKDAMDTDMSGNLSIHDLVYRLIVRDGSMERDTLYERIAALKKVAIDKIKGAVNTAVSRYKKKKTLEQNGDTIGLAKDNFVKEEGFTSETGEEPWTVRV